MKKHFFSLLIFILLFLIVSCSFGPVSPVADSKNDNLKNSSSKELNIYIMDYDTTAKNAIAKFNDTHKDVQIKSKSLVAIPADNLGSKLMYELNSDMGPDIILCEQSTLPNLSVFIDKGSFYDLNTLISNDKSFKKTDYFEKVMEYGAYKDKRYIIPLSFKIDSLYTTKEILDKSGQCISSTGAGIDDFVKGSAKYITANTNNSSSAGNDMYYISDISIGSLLQTTPKSFFDLVNETADFNSKDFGDLMDKYKSMSEATCPDIMVASPAESNSLLSNDRAVFASIQTMGPRYSADPYGSFKTEVEPVIIPAPYADTTRHVIAKPEKYIGINSKCGNIEAAYDFIKLLLSKDFQDTDIMEGIPVNREVYEQEKENCLKGLDGYNTWKKGGCKNTGTLKKLYSQLDELIYNIDRCWTTDDYLLTIVQDEVGNYVKSNSTKENTLKAIQEKVEGYLKSGIMTTSLNKEDDSLADPAKTVSLYYWDVPCYVGNAEFKFKQQYPDLALKTKIFSSLSDFYQTTAIELMAGGGPDIVIFKPRYFNSINKTVQNGAFCEMDEYIKKYEILKGDYNKYLLHGGVYNGKRYYIPLFYVYNAFITSKQILEKNSINIPKEGWTWSKFASFATEFMSKNKGKNKYFISSSFDFTYMIRCCDVPLIDYDNNKSNFNSDSFKELLKLYRELYPSISPEKVNGSLKNDTVVMSMATMAQAETVKMIYEDFTSYGIGEMTAIDFPTFTGAKKIFVNQDDSIAVNSKCKNKEIAFKYIKIASSYELQRDRDSRGISNNFLRSPINDKAFKDDILSYPIAKDLPELVNKLINTREKFEECYVKEYNIWQMADDIAKEYIDGTKNLEQAAKEMDDKVNLFLNE